MLRKELQTCKPRMIDTREGMIRSFVIERAIFCLYRLWLVASVALGPLPELWGMQCAIIRRLLKNRTNADDTRDRLITADSESSLDF